MSPITHCGAIILAAGKSARIGLPKQLLRFAGKTLLQHTIDAAKGANVQAILLVLGANKELIISQTDLKGIHVIENQDWQTGMASSIVSGISALEDVDPLADGALLMVCDQPFVTSALLNELIAAQQKSRKPFAASKYDDILGVPALFHKSIFDELIGLKGDHGARKIIERYGENVAFVDFPEGSIDIDTMSEYEKLK
ncbi:MAG: nucleotidyltransferase family protein [Bacteroidetes bacterium]|nr:nucleotidyltransferase family protein [Bacteroidota bacterium]